MSIKTITLNQLRQMKNQEGLVLQGCGGDPEEWRIQINKLLTRIGVLKNGSSFEEIMLFQNKGRTCLLFPFKENMDLHMGMLAVWRVRSREQFEGVWLSDYLEFHMDELKQEAQSQNKPDCPLIGANGNIFYLLGIASRTLRDHKMEAQAEEMRTRVEQSRNYYSAVSIIGEYVNITPAVNQEQRNEYQIGGM